MVDVQAPEGTDDRDKQLLDDIAEGRRRSMARAMALAESTDGRSRDLLAKVHRRAGRAHVVGITGVPGSGKSTMVRALAQKLREHGHRIGIVAVDPSSPFTGGAILGDRIRMTELSGDPGVFIRSMATRGALGGLARSTHEVVDVLDAAGYDIVLIETVGVGQDEVDIVQAAHSVVVISAPGLGDEIQAIKAGVLEIADIHVVSKCDRPEASKTVSDLRAMLRLGNIGVQDSGWQVPVIATSAQNREGIDAVVTTIQDHRRHLVDSGKMEARRRRILEMRVLKAAENIVRDQLLVRRRGRLDELLARTEARDVDPFAAATELIGDLIADVQNPESDR